MSSTSTTLIAFSPEQFIYLIIAIVTATVAIISWVYRQTHSLDKKLGMAQKDITTIQKELDEQRPKLREMEILVARLTERLSSVIRHSEDEA
jgi:cell division protein FtsL